MEEAVKIDDFKKAKKKLEREQRTREKLEKASNWISNNPELGTIVVSALVGAGLATVKGMFNLGRSAVVSHRVNKQEVSKKLKVYDHSAGHPWYLRRPLSNEEWLNVEKRKAAGEKLKDILLELNVLK